MTFGWRRKEAWGVQPWRRILTGAVEMEAWDSGPSIVTHELFNEDVTGRG